MKKNNISNVPDLYLLREKVREILEKYLLEDGLMSSYRINYFCSCCLKLSIAKSIIGLEFWKNNHSKRMDNLDMQITLMHDLKGIMNNENCFIPRSNEYQKFCTI